ncbi:class I SAM-dependent methyltransferase [Sphingobacterium bambusae]|uniref:Eco57I restriction-modification methylase domain-containing protein n=1 Tax=Sphingobacterium bambusae TaxID=662858 RepID=A0ABW6BBL5_9SPHI|nr:class I SAM-dependent methyltransferase [Sphingobacterium bambusae]WPL49157.1 class I SAM-dependent methyltransferase [Sphingobacterium bambusae]
MAFNKRRALQDNIIALQTAFTLESEGRPASHHEMEQLRRYHGFGGLKFILNAASKPEDIAAWPKADRSYFTLTNELYSLLKKHSKDDQDYKIKLDSMRSSVLSSFYTPPPLTKAIATAFLQHGIQLGNILEPSAGVGVFLDAFAGQPNIQTTAYEKDMLTGMILGQLHPSSRIHIKGFEEIPQRDHLSYDLVVGNIPFGEASVFDLSYSRGKDITKKQAAQNISNYFFIKGADMLREGGILAFISSQSLMNGKHNQPIRQALLGENNLIAAFRLPNNLFTDHAGTQVGSDLTILQRNSNKQSLNTKEQAFITNTIGDHGEPTNAYFDDHANIIHTQQKLGKDPYGRTAMLYLRDGGVEAIAKDLLKGLSKALSDNFKQDLYLATASTEIKTLGNDIQKPTNEIIKIEKLNKDIETNIHDSQPEKPKQLSIFDQHDSELPPNSKNPKSIAKAKLNRTQTSKKPSPALIQGNLFATAQDQRLSTDISSTANAPQNTKNKQDNQVESKI